MDAFLDNQGLWRKHMPRDGTCLFRAVSEQVYHTQAYHLDVRYDCIQLLSSKKSVFEPFVDGNYEEYLENLNNPKVWAGHVEMGSMSLLYRMDFAVFEEVGQVPTQITMNNFGRTILLCYSQGNHYDLIFRKDQLDSLAFCQALIYGLLYKEVFSLGADVDYAVQKMLYDKAYSKKKKSLTLPQYRAFEEKWGKCQIQEVEEDIPEGGECECGDSFSAIRKLLSQGCPPFPYKVAKALDPDIYRNVEYDRWNQARREQERADQLVVPDFAPGVKCLVRLMENQMFHAHIQEMSPNNGPVTVFIEELGEKKIIPFDHLQPLAIPVYKALAMQGYNCKKSIRFLDGYLKNSPLMSLTTLVADGLRNGRKYLKKKVKEVPFLLPLMEKSGNTWSQKSTTGTAISSWQLGGNKSQSRYLMDKVKVVPSTNKDDKQAKKMIRSETDFPGGGVKSRQSSSESGLCPKVQTPAVKSPCQPQGTTTGVGVRVNGQPGLLTAPPFPHVLEPNQMTYPCMPPYTMVGAVANTEAHDNQMMNPCMAIDAYGNPFFYTVGTCEVPFFHQPRERTVNATTSGNGAEIATGLQACALGNPPVPTAAGEMPPLQNTSFWTYNGSFTYMPTQPTAMMSEGCEWAISPDDPRSTGFAAMTPGVPLFFFMAPQAMNSGIVNNPTPFLPGTSNM